MQLLPLHDVRDSVSREFRYGDISLPIPEEKYREVYVPIMQEIDVEPALAQKYGGSIPFFVDGDTWPTERLIDPEYGDAPLCFIAQFIDPRYARNELTQIFMMDEKDFGPEAHVAWIRKIDLSKPFKQIIIEEPENVPNKEMIEPFEIIGWRRSLELAPSTLHEFTERLRDLQGQNGYRGDYHDIYSVNDRSFSQFKLGGYGNSCQGEDYDFEYQNVFAEQWGDCGTLHINADGTIDGDMG